MTSIEPTGGAVNDICIFRDSGLFLLALDCSQIPAYFIPALGPAPKWCSHLDNLTVWNNLFNHLIFLAYFCSLRHWGYIQVLLLISLGICFLFPILQEEMEEGTQSVIYDDYKFLTKEDLERLNLTHLIGTNLLRAYMHGFFVDYRLYKKVFLHFNIWSIY